MLRSTGCKRILHYPTNKLHEHLMMAEIQTVLRKGKYIIMPLSNDNVLVLHLGMTGRLLTTELPEVGFDERFTGENYIDKHTHFLLELSHPIDDVPDLELRFHDPRMFGHIWLVENAEDINNLNVPGLKDLGPDALNITLADFQGALKRSRRTIKAFLLDQTKLAGVGNIYADEACFVAKINPGIIISELTEEQQAKLWFAIKTVLKEGIKYRGSSTSDYTGIDGSKGSYQKLHRVYGRNGMPCVECASPVVRVKIIGRSTHFCPVCQPISKVGEGVNI